MLGDCETASVEGKPARRTHLVGAFDGFADDHGVRGI
jgi:hypothetical protein